MYLNYKTGSAEGISLAFLGVWLIGDITNLSGMFDQRASGREIIETEIIVVVLITRFSLVVPPLPLPLLNSFIWSRVCADLRRCSLG